MRRAALALSLSCVTACTTFVPVTAPQQYIPDNRPPRIWVTRSDSRVVMVEAPRLLGDTLTGFVNGDYQEMLLAEVREISTRRAASRRTALLVGGAALAGAGLIVMLSGHGPDGGRPSSEDPVTPGGQRVRP